MAKCKIDSLLKRIYPVILAISLFTGFGNMPIYKRYYISAIPGMGWAGNIYINLNIHYIAGIILIGCAVYFSLIYYKTRVSKGRLTTTGMLRAILIGLALISGALLAIRNLSEVNFGFSAQIAVTFMHLIMAMILMIVSLGCGIVRSPWRRDG